MTGAVMLMLQFFFSSRRRHTRSLCDWSSDVCSSDLFVALPVVLAAAALRLPIVIHEQTMVPGLANRVGARFARRIAVTRSEERRVGKECRTRWGQWEYK